MSSRNTPIIEKRPDKLEIPLFLDCRKKSILLLLISMAGLLVSLMSGFQESIPFLKSLCSNACRDTAEIHFLHMPLWLLGALFYSAAAMLALFRREMADMDRRPRCRSGSSSHPAHD